MKLFVCGLAAILLASTIVHADLQAEEMAAYGEMKDTLAFAQKLVEEGRADEAEQKLLAAFPEKTRTPVQSVLLGNLLFRQDAKTSYTLHKSAAAGLPHEPSAQLEWAMEQHRAGEYAAASETYAKVIKENPENALLYGLRAECLLRSGKTADAIETWNQSEKAQSGTLEQLESSICEVNSHRMPDLERAGYMKKARAGDMEAAVKLVNLDSSFPIDWWNNGPREKYLKVDLAMLHQTKFADAARLREITCQAECGIALAAEDGNADVTAILTKAGFLYDPDATLPGDGCALSVMIEAAQSKNALSEEDARAKWGAAVLAKARQSHDAEYINVAAHLFVGTETLAEIDRLGWDHTGDVRFAGSLLTGMSATLKPADPLLQKAVTQFPDDATIASVNLRCLARAKMPLHDALIHAIEAEYRGFSFQGGFTGRPSCIALRSLFKKLGEE